MARRIIDICAVELASTKIALQTQITANEVLTTQNTALTTANTTLTTQNTAITTANTTLTTQNATLTAANATLITQNAALTTENNQLKTDKLNINFQITLLLANNAQLQQENTNQQATLCEVKGGILDLSNILKEVTC